MLPCREGAGEVLGKTKSVPLSLSDWMLVLEPPYGLCIPIKSDTDFGRGNSADLSTSTRDIVRAGRGIGGFAKEFAPCLSLGRGLPCPDPPFRTPISGGAGLSGRIPAAARRDRT